MNSIQYMIPLLQTKAFNFKRGVDNASSEYYLSIIRSEEIREALAIKRQEKDFLLMLETSKKSRVIKLKRIERCIFTTDYAILD